MNEKMWNIKGKNMLRRWTQLKGTTHTVLYIIQCWHLDRFRAVYNVPEMEETAPKLKEEDLEHVVIFHDECAFHANDYKQNYWLLETQQVLKKKDSAIIEFIHSKEVVKSPLQSNLREQKR